MPDYVYALHDFQPEHDDEVSFRQGERIEVIERDDLYSDGWWQVSYIYFYPKPPRRHVAYCISAGPSLIYL
jgi:Variant SH3 domain